MNCPFCGTEVGNFTVCSGCGANKRPSIAGFFGGIFFGWAALAIGSAAPFFAIILGIMALLAFWSIAPRWYRFNA